jgi:hypothetical protein
VRATSPAYPFLCRRDEGIGIELVEHIEVIELVQEIQLERIA